MINELPPLFQRIEKPREPIDARSLASSLHSPPETSFSDLLAAHKPGPGQFTDRSNPVRMHAEQARKTSPKEGLTDPGPDRDVDPERNPDAQDLPDQADPAAHEINTTYLDKSISGTSVRPDGATVPSTPPDDESQSNPDQPKVQTGQVPELNQSPPQAPIDGSPDQNSQAADDQAAQQHAVTNAQATAPAVAGGPTQPSSPRQTQSPESGPWPTNPSAHGAHPQTDLVDPTSSFANQNNNHANQNHQQAPDNNNVGANADAPDTAPIPAQSSEQRSPAPPPAPTAPPTHEVNQPPTTPHAGAPVDPVQGPAHVSLDHGDHSGGTTRLISSTPHVAAGPEPTSESLGTQAVRGMMAIVRAGGGRLTMKLEPESLGSMRIQLNISHGRVQAQFHASTLMAREMLQQQTESLRSALDSQGLRLDRVSIHALQPGSEGDSSRPGSQHGRSGQGQQQHHDAADQQSRGSSHRDQQRQHSGQPGFQNLKQQFRDFAPGQGAAPQAPRN